MMSTARAFTMIPIELYEDESITLQEAATYGLVLSLSNKYGYCFASNKKLAQKLNMSVASLKRYLSNLCKNGYLKSDLVFYDGVIQYRKLTPQLTIPENLKNERPKLSAVGGFSP